MSVQAEGRVKVRDITSAGDALITLTSATGFEVRHGQLNSATTPDISLDVTPSTIISSVVSVDVSSVTVPLSTVQKPTPPSIGVPDASLKNRAQPLSGQPLILLTLFLYQRQEG